MSLILCIETGTDVCSVGIAKDGELLSLRESDEGRDHARKVGVFVDELLRETGIAPDELDAVAVGDLGRGLCGDDDHHPGCAVLTGGYARSPCVFRVNPRPSLCMQLHIFAAPRGCRIVGDLNVQL